MSNKVTSPDNYVNPFETGYFVTGQHDLTKIKNNQLRAEYCGNRADAVQFVNINSSAEEKQTKNSLDEILENRRLII